MQKILLIHENEISKFLKKSLIDDGFIVYSSDNQDRNLEDLSAIIDLTNSQDQKDSNEILIHNTGEIKSLMDLAKTKNSPFIFVYKEPIQLKPEDSINIAIDFIHTYAQKFEINYATVQIEDIYGQNLNTSQNLNGFIKNIVKSGSIKITNDLYDLYLMHENDFVSGLKAIIAETSTNNKSSHYTLFNPEPITEIELAHFITELTDLKIDLSYGGVEEKSKLGDTDVTTYFPQNWNPSITLEEGLIQLFAKYDIPTHNTARDEFISIQSQLSQDLLAERIKLNSDYKNTPENLPIKSLAVSASVPAKLVDVQNPNKVRVKIAVLASIFAFAIALPSFTFTYNATSAITYLNKSQKEFNKNNDLANNYSKKSLEYFNRINKIPKQFSFTTKTINNAENLAEMILYTTNFYAENFDTDNKNIAMANDSVLGASTSTIENPTLDKALELAVIINSSSNDGENSKLFLNLQNNIFSTVAQNKNTLEKLKNIQSIIPKFVYPKQPQKYLVLVQNPEKIRASGGLIESYAIVEIKDAKLEILKVGDISDIDNQIELNKINIPAPKPIQQSYNNSQLFIKDSNWDPNFQKSAKQTLQLYEMATGENIDGVIAIKNALFDKLLISKSKELDKLIPSLILYLDSKEILVYHEDNQIASALIKNNWGGSINSENFDDYLYIIDSNLGKENSIQNITRTTEYEAPVPTGENGFVRKVTITYHNLAKQSIGVRGDYLNYVRIIVPQDSFLNSAKIITEKGENIITRSMEIAPIEGKVMYSTELLVENGKTISLVIEYQSALKLYEDNQINLLIQKQPSVSSNEIIATLGNTKLSINLDEDSHLIFPL